MIALPLERSTLDSPGDFIGGAFETAPSPDELLRIQSPADRNDLVATHPTARSQVDRAVDTAREAQRAWRRRGRSERAALLRAYQARIRGYEDEITLAIAREVGKPLWEARTEAKALAAKVDAILGEGSRFVEDQQIDELPGEIRYRPHGVVAVVGPFNFPVHLPNGQIIPSLLLGNTVIFKPSEKTPSAAYWMARAYSEAGFPAGVFNLVQGGVNSSRALISHPGIDGILFTGSAAVGRAIVRENADQLGKLIALELGGKNASIVLEDADLDRTARLIAFAGFATAGQRCTATSRVYAARSIIDPLIERLHRAAEVAVVGYPLNDGVFLGPVISEASRAAILAAQDRAVEAGFERVTGGGPVEIKGHPGNYLRPALHRAPSGDAVAPGYTREELFGPDIAVYPVDGLDEAVARTNDSPFGLSAAVFTASRERFERAADELRVGVIHHNRPSSGASGRLPFGGVKDSGNHRPAGIMIATACAYPQGILHAPKREGELPTWPGLTLD
ncbi:MAG: aldehyde dehydrogenase family protein [Myxococcota bacterium]